MKELIVKGKTIDEATELALRQMNATRDDVVVEPLSAGSAGFLGFGRRPAEVKVTVREDDRIRASLFLKNILRHLDIQTSLSVKEEVETIHVFMGEEASVLIGHHGQTLDSLQYLVARYLNEDKEEWRKVLIDIDNYRDKREENLKSMAERMAQQVIQSKRDLKTEPLTAPERRIIHMTLKEFTEITTFSIGEGNRKRVVIALSDRSGARRRSRGRRGGGSGGGSGSPRSSEGRRPVSSGGRSGDRPSGGRPNEGGNSGGSNRNRSRSGSSRRRRPSQVSARSKGPEES